jgi:uncharacterized protein (DUF2062 family)
VTSPTSNGFFQDKIVIPFKNQLKQGVTPKQLALTCAVGSVIGIFPLLGVTTFLCILLGLVWKLNQPILQAVNYLLYPVQLLLLPTFILAGEKVTGSEPVSFNPSTVVKDFMADPRLFLAHYGMAGFHAVLVWAVIAPILAWAVYQLSLRIFLKLRVNPI